MIPSVSGNAFIRQSPFAPPGGEKATEGRMKQADRKQAITYFTKAHWLMSAVQEAGQEKTADTRVRWSLLGTASPGAAPQSIVVRDAVFRIGRRQEMDLTIDSPVVSGAHAELFQIADNLYVRDSGSTNGTFVNGKRITTETLLFDGAVLEIANISFRVLSHRREPATPAASIFMKTCFANDALDTLGRRSLAQLLGGGTAAPCFQSIHCLYSGAVRGHEFLARSTYPGIETAGQLFEQARKAGREVELSMFCRTQAMKHSHFIAPDLPIFMNTHPLEPLLDGVVPQMLQLRQQYPNRAIVLEIHEGANTEPGVVRELRQRLAEAGIKLAFDDFGNGQARIRELISASADYIKFDPSLIRELLEVSAEQRRFFASIIRGIQSEGVVTVAEGVETEDMATLCRDMGFDLVQGYLFSRPTILKCSAQDNSNSEIGVGSSSTGVGRPR